MVSKLVNFHGKVYSIHLVVVRMDSVLNFAPQSGSVADLLGHKS